VRKILIALGADCKTPLGAYAERIESSRGVTMRLRAFVVAPSGETRRADETAPWPETDEDATSLGDRVGKTFL
jgi:porphobilinogen deaminase